MRTLGLDVGPNSIGWALVDEDERRIIDLGVRVFPEGVANFDTAREVSRSEARRMARTARRQTQRRRRRKAKLKEALIDAGLFPSDRSDQDRLFALDPYELRARALDERLSLHEIGRVILHLAQRRGYLSNSRRENQSDDGKVVLAEINVTAAQIEGEGCRTLGEFLAKRQRDFDHRAEQRPTEDVLPNQKKEALKERGRVRNRHLYRSMYLDEFDLIWERQSKYYPETLTNELKYGAVGPQRFPTRPRPLQDGRGELEQFGLHGLVFFHRSLKPVPKEIIGLCELEPRERRCPLADRQSQRARVLQEINNLRYTDPDTGEEFRLDDSQRRSLIEFMEYREKATFDKLRERLGFLDSVRFNLERGKRSSIKGMETDWRLTKAIGASWRRRDEEEKNTIVRLLIDERLDDATLAARLIDEHGVTRDEANALLRVELPKGYARLSRKALAELTPHLERGLVMMSEDESNSAIHAAGYLRRDQLRRRLFDELPDPSRVQVARIGEIPNPVVKRALTELRKVVNAVIREYGKPDAVHIEMGRDLRTRPTRGTEAYRRYQNRISEMRERERRRDEAKAELSKRGLGYGAGGRNIVKYLLWKEQAQECVYCGEPISQSQLFSSEVDLDHILPYSRCLDDSKMNQVVCHRHCNHGDDGKNQRTPYEWLAESDPERYERVCQQVLALVRRGLFPYAKYKRFRQKELLLDDFIQRQLNDTRYIARLGGEYLRCLFNKPSDVLGLKGQLTSTLRHVWGLGTVLAELEDSPAWEAQSDLRPGEKNRADHRHHALDALIVALTNRSRLQRLSRIARSEPSRRNGSKSPGPWDGFRDEVTTAIQSVRVSHRPERKVSGRLHEDTFYGAGDHPGQFVARKPVDELSPNEVEKIRDAGIRRIVTDTLTAAGIEIGRGKRVDKKAMAAALTGLTMPSGVPIRKVRVLKPEQTIRPIREGSEHEAFVKPGENHHVCLFEWNENGKVVRDAEYCSLLEAARRVRSGEPIVRRAHSESPSARFIMSLCTGDLVLVDEGDGERVMVVSTLVSTQKRVHLVDANDARRSSDKKDIGLTPNSLLGKYAARKVTIDPLGRVRWAAD